MYEGILVPLDGSSTAEMVLPYIEEIAAKLGAEIFLTSVAESSAADMDRLSRSYLEHVMERVRHQLKDYGARGETMVQSDVLQDKPSAEILRYADEKDVNLIGMAGRWFIRSGAMAPGEYRCQSPAGYGQAGAANQVSS